MSHVESSLPAIQPNRRTFLSGGALLAAGLFALPSAPAALAADAPGANILGPLPGYSPQVTPDACSLQLLCASTFRLLQRVGPFGWNIVRNPHIHLDLKQHGYEPVLRLAST